MTTFKQKALEALKQMILKSGNTLTFQMVDQHNQTIRDCISRIEAIEESESIDYNKASLEANATLSKFIHMKI